MLTPEEQSFDWTNYPIWKDTTEYKTTLYVAKKHPAADDANTGSVDAPFKTIQAAAEIAQPGTRILIHEGIYREMVEPSRGGEGTDKMISYEAAEDEYVEIRGSRIFEGEWARPKTFTPGVRDGASLYNNSQRTWMAELPDSLFDDGYDPINMLNVTPPEEIEMMDWMIPVQDKAPFHLSRLMVFSSGERLTQLHQHEDLVRLPGTFFVDRERRQVWVHLADSSDPNNAFIEIAVQSHLFCPKTHGFNHIAVRGLHFSQCANGFLRASTGAVNALGGGYWIIEDCNISQCNSSGLEFGDAPFEGKQEHPKRREKKCLGIGHNIVRNNTISECGTAGIRCLHVEHGRVLNNTIFNCCWQEAEYYFECAGIKLLVNVETLVAHNHIYNIDGGCGIWMDWNNKHSRVTRNRIENINGYQGGIFIEASITPNLIDHNLIKDIDGPGIFGGDSSNQIYSHNWVGPCTGDGVRLICHTDRIIRDGIQTSCNNNQVLHNTFEQCGPHTDEGEDNNFEDAHPIV